MVWQPDQPQHLGELAGGRQVTQTSPGQGERLAHGASHHQPLAALDQRQRARRAGSGELGVCLVHHHDRLRSGAIDRLDDVKPQRCAGRVVGRTEEHDVRLVCLDLRHSRCDVQIEGPCALHTAQPVDPSGAGRPGDDRVHRIGRGEAQCHPVWAAERLEDVQQNLIGPVSGPYLLGRHGSAAGASQIGGQILAEPDELAVRVAVQTRSNIGHRPDDRVDHVLGNGIRVLVGVQRKWHVELRGAIGCPAAQVRAQQIAERTAHFQRPPPERALLLKRATTASPWAGRSSASASVTTWFATSRRPR